MIGFPPLPYSTQGASSSLTSSAIMTADVMRSVSQASNVDPDIREQSDTDRRFEGIVNLLNGPSRALRP